MGALPTRIATRLLARDGIGAIWQLHEAAASAQLAGHQWAAEIMIEIADAAEQICDSALCRDSGRRRR